MSASRSLADATGVAAAVDAIADAVLAHPVGTAGLVVVGIRRRGDALAHRLVAALQARGSAVSVGTLDITFYRDDLARLGPQPIVKGTEVPFDISDRRVVLVDDVLFTGRTVRAALDLLADLGRPARIELAVLVDRTGGREMPIHADYAAHTVAVGPTGAVSVRLAEIDGHDAITVREAGGDA